MISYVLGATTSGPMIMCRFDGAGVAGELLRTSKHEQDEIDLVIKTARRIFGEGPVNCVDGGANVGCWTVQLAKALGGIVHAFEPQRRLYYALAGNVALNNCHHAVAHLAALTDVPTKIAVPQLDVTGPAPFSTVRLNQPTDAPHDWVDGITIDSINHVLHCPFQLLKLDIEGMEADAIRGAQYTIQSNRPIIFAEVHIGGPLQLLDYWETRVSPDQRNALYIPKERGHIDL